MTSDSNSDENILIMIENILLEEKYTLLVLKKNTILDVDLSILLLGGKIRRLTYCNFLVCWFFSRNLVNIDWIRLCSSNQISIAGIFKISNGERAGMHLPSNFYIVLNNNCVMKIIAENIKQLLY